jgi:DNA (cytosine-5)-methyltransferase 1
VRISPRGQVMRPSRALPSRPESSNWKSALMTREIAESCPHRNRTDSRRWPLDESKSPCQCSAISFNLEKFGRMSYTVVDLFSGCGGLSSGFNAAGFRIIAAYDLWEAAIDTYQKNFNHDAFCLPLDYDSKIPNADVIIGGPPCQGFSSAGLRRQGDHRNTLVSVFASLILRVRPMAFVFENVEGFLTGCEGHYVLELLNPLIEAGYRIHLKKINASNYGVPQHRKRVLAIGGLGWEPSFPGHTHSSHGAPGATLLNQLQLPFCPSLSQALEGLPNALARTKSHTAALADHDYSPLSSADFARAMLLQPGQTMRDLPESMWHGSFKRRANRRVSDGTPTERRGGPRLV